MLSTKGAFDVLISKLLVILFALTPVADFISIYSRFNWIEGGERFTLFYRTIFILVAFYFVRGLSRGYVIGISFMIFFATASIAITSQMLYSDDLLIMVESIILSYKFFVYFVLLGSFFYIIRCGMISRAVFEGLVDLLILIYCASIIVGGLFNVEMFRSYGGFDSVRWGVKGIIIAGNEASGFLTISLAWMLLRLNKILGYIKLIVVVLACIVIGTKAAILAVVLVLGAYFIAKYRFRSVYYIGLMLLGISLLFVFSYASFESVQIVIDQNFDYFIWQYDNIAKGDFLSLALSGRDYKFVNVFEVINANAVWVYFFGGYPVAGYTIEMDLFDAIALLGLFGALGYFWMWFSTWGTFDATFEGSFKLYFCIIFFALGLFGGHYFYSAMAAPFLAALCLLFNRYYSVND